MGPKPEPDKYPRPSRDRQVCPSCGYAYGGEVELGDEIQQSDELSLDKDEEEARRRQFADALRRRM